MSTSLAVVHDSRYDSPEMIRTLKETVCKGATDAQFMMFTEVCKATGLNPFLKEIWFVPNVGVMAGRDGYLRVANDHPMFDGMSTLVDRDKDGVPIKATCTVWRKDRAHPIVCEAYYNEYRKPSSVWTTYKSAMIGKVAEVLALKRSFAINGVVTEEEIGVQAQAPVQAYQHESPQSSSAFAPREERKPPIEPSDAAEPPVEEPPPNHNLTTISEPQQKRIFALMRSVGKSPDDVLEIILRKGFNSTKEITKDRYEAICNEILRPKDA